MIKSLQETGEIFGLEMFATIEAAAALCERLREKRSVLFLRNSAAGGALMKEPSRAPLALALIESFWGFLARLPALFWVERVSSGANPVDAPSRSRPLYKKPGITGKLASV